MTTGPRVSVVVLSHRFDMAIEAMRSVKAQTYPQELIDLRLEHAFDYYPEKFNNAWAGCRGEYLMFLPDDDTLNPPCIQRHVEEAQRTAADMVYSDLFVTGPLTLKWHMPEFDEEIVRRAGLPWMTFLIRRALWEQMGGWDGTLFHADWDVGIRLCKADARVTHIRQEYLWNRSYHRSAASATTTADDNLEALRILRRKHPSLTLDASV